MTNQEQDVVYGPDGCDAWIPGVPKSVPRARVLELIEALGLDIHKLRGLRIEPNAIYAEVYAFKDGARFWDGAWRPDAQVATHRIAIAITDTQDPDADV
jgi:hypothetical protein